MKKKIFAVIGSAVLIAGTAFAGSSVHWSYSGAEGPEYWGKLSEKFALCSSGKNQSPINITDMIEADLNSIEFDYKNVPLEIINNGHTIQVTYAEGSKLSIDGKSYNLVQFHFHTPSENHIDSKSFAMEGHLVHSDAEGNLAVIGVMFNDEAENPFIKAIWNNMPAEAGKTISLKDVSINAMDMLPKDKTYYRFNGSLTTPPCTEGVRWMVLKNTVTISHEQVEKFHSLMHHDNNRPIQPAYARPVLK